MVRRLLLFALVVLLFSPALRAAESGTLTGEAIFNERCADVCHQTPALGRLKPKQWRRVLHTMQTRMSSVGMEPLSDEAFEKVLRYVSQGR